MSEQKLKLKLQKKVMQYICSSFILMGHGSNWNIWLVWTIILVAS